MQTTTTATGTALRTLRQAAGLTLQQVAAGAGVSISYLSRVENGLTAPRPQWVQVVTEYLGSRIEDAA